MSSPRFVGRGQELSELTRTLAAPPALVLIEGEAGIGKSRLISEFFASPAGREQRSLMACCPPFGTPQTLAPVIDAFRQTTGGVHGLRLSALAGALRPLFPEWTADLPPTPEPAEDATAARHRVFRALAELAECLDIALVIVEDAHWADAATLEFLLYLASRPAVPAQAISLVVTCRPEDVPAGALLSRLSSRVSADTTRLRLALGPLDVAEIAGLVSSMLAGGHVSDEFAAFVHQHTEGVPLAVEESVRLLAERGDVFRYDGGWARRHLTDITVPRTIRDAVLERAARLTPDARAALRAAAVLTEPADDVAISTVTCISAARTCAGLSAALECGLLAEGSGGLLRFRHALARQAIYEAIPGPDLRVLHMRAGRALEVASPPPSARLARHFREAGETGLWCRYGEQAADLALASGDEMTAVVQLHDLLTNACLPTTVVARLTRMFPFSALTGQTRFQELIDALKSVLDTRVLEPEEEADISVQLGQALTHMQKWAEGRAELERAIPLLEHDPVARARAMLLLAWPRGTTCPAAVHARWLRRAAELAGPMEPVDRLRFAVDRTSALLMLGEEQGWAEAAKIPLEAPTAPERREIARSHLNIGDQALRWGRYSEAAWRLAQALNLGRSHQYWSLHDDAMATRIHLDWVTGSWNGLAGRATALADDTDIHLFTRLEAALVIGLLDAAAGAGRQAGERLQLVRAETEQRAEMEYVMEPAAALARLWLADGRAADALEVTEAPIGVVMGKGIWVWAADLAPARVAALTAVGRIGEADELVTAFAQGLRGRDAPAPRAGLMTCRAILAQARGEHARAATLFARTATAWQALPRPYDALLARERQARCLLDADSSDKALALLSQAFHGLAELGARGDSMRVMHTMREHGLEIRRPWWGGRKGYGERLSPRELDVARLLVQGRGTREIARDLFLSPRTVERHLSSAMRKLNVSSRTALAVRVVEAGIVSGHRSVVC